MQGDKAMQKGSVCIQIIVLLLAYMFYIAPYIHPASAAETDVYIKADGSVYPQNASISNFNNSTYTFTADIINRSIVVERSNITIDGQKHKLVGRGRYNGTYPEGFKISNISNLTIRRVIISDCYWAIHMTQCSNCTIEENEITNNSYGIFPEWSNNSLIMKNKIMNNQGGGIYVANSFNFIIKQNLIAANPSFGIGFIGSTNSTVIMNAISNNGGPGIRIYTSTNIRLHHNDFVNNADKAFSQSSTVIWDDGSEGNYWSDYNGTDANQDGIGDTPYVIDSNNADRYPLMRPLTVTLMGDINYDGVVNILDITIIGSAYGSNQTEPNYNLQADLAPPYGVINMFDAVTCAAHYAETFP
jgi:parallel beta-helix repeat protein